MNDILARKTLFVITSGAFLGGWLAVSLWTTAQDRQVTEPEAMIDHKRESFELDFVEADEPETPTEETAEAEPTPVDAERQPEWEAKVASAGAVREGQTTRRSSQITTASLLDPLSTDISGGQGVVDLSGLDAAAGTTDINRRSSTAALLRRYERTGVRHCYEQRLKSEPDLHGRWTVRFIIGRDGRPHSTRVSGQQVSDEALERCISQAITSWRFAPEMRGIEIEKSYGLAPGA